MVADIYLDSSKEDMNIIKYTLHMKNSTECNLISES